MAQSLAELRREAARRYERSKAAIASNVRTSSKGHPSDNVGSGNGLVGQGNVLGTTKDNGGGDNGGGANLMMPAPKNPIAKQGASPQANERTVRMADDPEELMLIESALASPAVRHAVEVLTDPGSRVRGCMVDPDRPCLQALQNILTWTLGGYDTRPPQEVEDLKHHDRLQVLLRYRQPPPVPGLPPRVAMYDYLCETLFAVPMRPVADETQVCPIQDLEGNIMMPSWVEPDWETFQGSSSFRRVLAPVFQPNRYPYQLPVRQLPDSCHEFQRKTQHWILWYHHYPDEPLVDPSDDVIDFDVRREVSALVKSHGFEACDYIWYRNPGMSVPDMFHVQVFWIVPEP